MKLHRPALIVAIVAVALGGCGDDVSSPFAPDDHAFAKGGNKGGGDGGEPSPDLTAIGQLLFEDANLSVNLNQSCQSCHEPSEGFAAPLASVTTEGSVVQGSEAGQFGNRKPPSAAYATLAPLFANSRNASGGLFWDGRATGGQLGSPAADQALGPFVNPAEQAMPDEACVVYRVATGSYTSQWVAAHGAAIEGITWPSDVETVCTTFTTTPGELVTLSATDRTTVETAYHQVAQSVAAFESTLNRFSSRFDQGTLNALEQQGEKLFGSNGKCQQCHANKGSEPLFSDFEFHNLGVPANPDNPAFTADGAFDPGLGGVTGEGSHLGKFRTPTIRNVAAGENRTYMHNGVLVNLKQVVDFYNSRDVTRVCTPEEVAVLQPYQYGNFGPDAAGCWPAPEFGENMDTKNMGNLGLTEAEIDAIVAFMTALSDQ